MKYVAALCLSFCCLTGISQKAAIILDTDIGPDYDDVGAMALLHALADRGEATILATISCNANETTGPTLSVLNTYFRRPEIPVGIVKAEKPNQRCKELWAQYINEKYPHPLLINGDALDAVKLYRKILAGQPDKSVMVVTVGFFTNLAGLLDSPADEYSSLPGRELVIRKVKQLVSMAAGLGEDGKSEREYNVLIDAPASKKVLGEWPAPITLSGFEIGLHILTGARLVADNSIQNSPVKEAYQVALTANKLKARCSWDQTAVLVAVRGAGPYFNTRQLNFDIQPDGRNVLVPGERFTYLTTKMPPEEVAKVIEDLMMHQPGVR